MHTLELLHTEVDELGRSVTAMRMNEKVHAERDDMGRSVHGVKAAERLHAYKWEDPDHPELGQTGAGPLSRMQRSRGYPHGPENRRRVYLTE